MRGDKSNIMPIMTNSESIYQFGANAYGKPTVALNILRDTIMGRELFDFAFKEYSKTWMFKHPTPSDFFRIMENASGVDLDWFWRGWFFTNDHVDLSIEEVEWFQLEIDPKMKRAAEKKDKEGKKYYAAMLDEKYIKQTVTDKDPKTKDFYDSYDEFADITDGSERRRYETMLNDAEISDEMKEKIMEKMSGKSQYEQLLDELSDNEAKLAKRDDHFYKIKFKNIGGLVMPLIIEMTYEDGSTDVTRIPVEIWRFNRPEVSKVFKTDKKVVSFTLDPFRETADTFRDNNHWPPKNEPTLFFLQRIRDEAHRFAVSAHRTRRKKGLSKSLLDQIEGIGSIRKRSLLNHFGSARAVESASLDEIKSVDGVEEKVAKKIYNFFHE